MKNENTQPKSETEAILKVRDLKVEFDTYGGVVKSVRGVSFEVHRGRTLAIVGESGCGKSVTVQSIMSLIPRPPGRITGGSVLFQGREILNLPLEETNQIRGKEIGMIFQDPMTSLNPTIAVGTQIVEALRYHDGISRSEARARAIELLKAVQITEAEKRIDHYPHQFSGGMRQRVMIAMAIACNPSVLIADEPTTALDVTVQAQVLDVLKKLQRERNMAIILITHDLGVVARMADDVVVMYAGQVVEKGTAEEVFYKSSHPYTLGLRSAMPSNKDNKSEKLVPIDGAPPDLFKPPSGCGYAERCPYVMKVCLNQMPELLKVEDAHLSRCWLQNSMAPRDVAPQIFRSGKAT